MSERQVYDLGDQPRVVFRACTGDLRIQGTEGPQAELLVQTDRDGIQVQQTESELQVSSTGSLTVRVPESATVAVEACSGDVRVTQVQGLRAARLNGDLVATQVGSVELEALNGDVQVGGSRLLSVTSLNGDLRVSAVQGQMTIDGIRGDVRLRAISGPTELHGITGDVSIRNLEGQIDVHDVNGDVDLSGNLTSGEYSVESNGDVRLQLDHSSDATLELLAPLGSISCSIKLADAQESPHGLTGILGQGSAKVRIVAASGDIKVRATRSTDVEDVLQDEMARVEECARRAAERAERMAEKMRRRGERLEQRAQRRAEQMSRLHGFGARARRPSASDGNVQEERLAVLRMLAEGKINAAQAEALLAALES